MKDLSLRVSEQMSEMTAISAAIKTNVQGGEPKKINK